MTAFLERRNLWLGRSEASLPPQSHVRQRNAKITATYARLYLEHPALFKWAGMAAFASFQVGCALAPFRLLLEHGMRADWRRTAKDQRAIAEIWDDIELLRMTNNAVYADIAWAHHAFVAEGIEELRNCLGAEARDQNLLAAFELLHEAKLIIAEGKPSARVLAPELVWKGNALLLEHEQRFTVQPYFQEFDFTFGTALTFTTMLDFDANARSLDRKTLSSFSLFMITWGLPLLWRKQCWPKVTDFDQRWFWITRRLLPKWQELDASDALLSAKMKMLECAFDD
jgi:hypothetical protein